MATVHRTKTPINLDPETALDRRLRELANETYDERPFEPDPDDLAYLAETDGHELAGPVAGILDLPEWLAAQAAWYRSRGSDAADWLGAAIDRMAQLVHWTGATIPAEHDDRMEVYDRELRERHYQDGYADGHAAAMRGVRL
jgi:hypothetical protein